MTRTHLRQHPTNTAAGLLRDLHLATTHDTTSHAIDAIASNLAAHLATAPGPLCVGLMRAEDHTQLYTVVHILNHYGVTMRKRARPDPRHVFVFLERTNETKANPVELSSPNERNEGRA